MKNSNKFLKILLRKDVFEYPVDDLTKYVSFKNYL